MLAKTPVKVAQSGTDPRLSLLPINYSAAKKAIENCVRVDECKDWADKALALKSYGKQANDKTLENKAQRIRDRAIRRGGELLKQVAAAKGGDRKSKGARVPIGRKDAAKAAGISPVQAKQMLRVASVPEPQFEQMVDGRERPATVKELAEAGTQKQEKPQPEPYRNEWIDWTGAVQHVAALPACGLDVLAVRRPLEKDRLLAECQNALANLNLWLAELEMIT